MSDTVQGSRFCYIPPEEPGRKAALGCHLQIANSIEAKDRNRYLLDPSVIIKRNAVQDNCVQTACKKSEKTECLASLKMAGTGLLVFLLRHADSSILLNILSAHSLAYGEPRGHVQAPIFVTRCLKDMSLKLVRMFPKRQH